MLTDTTLRIWKKLTNELQEDVHENSKKRGWWQEGEEPSVSSVLMNMVSELSECWDEYVHNRPLTEIWYNPDSDPPGKPEGIPVELADEIIRVLDAAEAWGIDVAEALVEKAAYNETRSWRHGNKLE